MKNFIFIDYNLNGEIMKILKLTFASLSLPLGVTTLINLNHSVNEKNKDNNIKFDNSKNINKSKGNDNTKEEINFNNVFDIMFSKYKKIENFWNNNSELFNLVDWENSLRIDNENRNVKISIVYKDSYLVFSNDELANEHDKIVNILSEHNNSLNF
jgi:hypothetical protein